MDRPALLDFGGRLVVNRLSEQIEYTPKALITYRNGNGTSRIDSIGSANQSVCGTHRNAADYIVTDLLRYFSDQFSVIHIDLDRIQQLRQFTLAESYIQYRTCDLYDLSRMFLTHLYVLL
jgi:hypothetical protein